MGLLPRLHGLLVGPVGRDVAVKEAFASCLPVFKEGTSASFSPVFRSLSSLILPFPPESVSWSCVIEMHLSSLFVLIMEGALNPF